MTKYSESCWLHQWGSLMSHLVVRFWIDSLKI